MCTLYVLFMYGMLLIESVITYLLVLNFKLLCYALNVTVWFFVKYQNRNKHVAETYGESFRHY